MASVSTHFQYSGKDKESRLARRRFELPHTALPDMKLAFVQEVVSNMRTTTTESNELQATVHRIFIECKKLRDHLEPNAWTECVKKIRESDLLPLVIKIRSLVGRSTSPVVMQEMP